MACMKWLLLALTDVPAVLPNRGRAGSDIT
jgi:hypothetical protein